MWEILHGTIRRKLKSIKEQESLLQKEREKLKQFESKISGEVAGDSEDEIPTEEKIERMEERIDAMWTELKTLFVTIFSKLVSTITSHIDSCKSQGRSFKDHWFRWAIYRLQQVMFEHHESVFKNIKVLETRVFSSDVDQHIRLIFRQFSSLRA